MTVMRFFVCAVRQGLDPWLAVQPDPGELPPPDDDPAANHDQGHGHMEAI